MLNELLEMLGGGDEDGESGCCQQRQPRAGGIRGFIAGLLSGDDGDNDRGRGGECCTGATGDGNTRDRADRRRDRDQQDDGFDFGD